MQVRRVAPYGTWRSPFSSDLIVSESIRLSEALIDGEDIYWLEGRPSEGGCNVIVRLSGEGKEEDILSPPYNARTLVHEYGGEHQTRP